ncbi:MAG: DUF4440 domain-containing protein [Gemmatimonadaceae bacterium]|nr:DUF4440 domain-containing protein [Gemmatimonadaceae bacterium]
MSRVAFLAVILGTSACAAPKEAPAPQPTAEEARATLDTWWASYVGAVKAGDATALAGMHATDVYLVEPGMPTMRGRDAVAAAFGEGFKVVKYAEVNIHPELTEWIGEQIFQAGSFDDRFSVQGKTQASYGRYTGLFAKDSTGAWRVVRALVAQDSVVTPKGGK